MVEEGGVGEVGGVWETIEVFFKLFVMHLFLILHNKQYVHVHVWTHTQILVHVHVHVCTLYIHLYMYTNLFKESREPRDFPRLS